MKFASTVNAAAVCLFLGTIVPSYAQHDEKQGDKHDGKERGQPSHAQEQPKQQQQQPVQQARPQPQRAEQAPQRQRAQAPEQQQPQHGQQAQPQRAQAPQQQQQRGRQAQPQRAQVPQQQQQRGQQAQPQQRAQQQQQRQRQQPQGQQGSILSQVQPQRTRQEAQSWQQQRGWLKQGGGWQGHDTFQRDSSRNWASDHRSWAQRGGYGGYYIPQNSFSLYFGSQHFFRLRTVPVMYLGYPRFEYEGTSFLLLDPWPQNWSQDWYASDDVYIDYDDGYYLYDRNYPQQRVAITVLL